MTTTPTGTRHRTPAPHRLSTTLLGLVLPLAVLAASAAVAFSWRDDLPDPVATHWDAAGTVDGFGSLAASAAVPLTIGAVLAVGFWLVGWFFGQSASNRRMAVGVSAGTATFLGATLLGTLWVQRGLDDAAQAADVGAAIAVAIGAGLLVGVLAGLVAPRDAHLPAEGQVSPADPRASLGDGERAAWIRTARGGPGMAVAGAAVVGTLVLVVFTGLWWMILLPVVLGLVMASMMSWTVTVDASGLEVRSALGLPRTFVPLDEVEGAREVTVDPFREFGGWGWRTGRGGRVGIVVRKGPGLEVRRSGGRVLVVTVDDAATGAALLTSLADRARHA